MFPSVRFLSLFCVLPALALGCAADDDGSVDVTEDDLTASLGTQALWLVPNGAEPKDDLIHAIAPQGGNKARVVYSYPAETIIRTSCLGTFKFVGTGASKTLQITCPSSTQPMVFSVTKSSTGRLELTTPKLKKSFVLQAPGKVKGDVSLSCVSDAFTAQVEIVGAGSARRLWISTKATKPAPGVPYDEALWLDGGSASGAGKFVGFDVRDNDYDFTLPTKLAAAPTLTLGYQDNLQYYPTRIAHTLSCK
jgi:hypothetical protein